MKQMKIVPEKNSFWVNTATMGSQHEEIEVRSLAYIGVGKYICPSLCIGGINRRRHRIISPLSLSRRGCIQLLRIVFVASELLRGMA